MNFPVFFSHCQLLHRWLGIYGYFDQLTGTSSWMWEMLLQWVQRLFLWSGSSLWSLSKYVNFLFIRPIEFYIRWELVPRCWPFPCFLGQYRYAVQKWSRYVGIFPCEFHSVSDCTFNHTCTLYTLKNVLFTLENIGTRVKTTWHYFPCLVLHKVE